MRAVLVEDIGGPEVLRLTDAEAPALGPGDVRVAVRSIGVNFRDVQQRRLPDGDQAPPFVPGSDFAGDVIEVGADVTGLRTGDRVVGVALAGAYAEEVVAPALVVQPIPDDVSYDMAASLPVAGLSASFLLSTSGLLPGDTAVTWAAAGGLGCFLGGVLAAAGVRTIGITSSEAKAEVARAAGHADVVDYRRADPVDAVLELTGGEGAHVVFDSVGGPDFVRSVRMLRNQGTVIVCGRAAGEPDIGAAAADLIGARRNRGLRDFYLGAHVFDHLDQVPGRLAALAAGVAKGEIVVPITAFPLADVRRAHEEMEAGRTVGKLVLHP